MTALLTGIVPVFAMIALGWGLKWRTFLNDDGWPISSSIRPS
jgi:predicted permease